MYNPQFFTVPMNLSQQPLPPTQFVNPVIHIRWQQPLVSANTLFHAGPVHQGMAASQQHHGQHQRAPSSGPSRNPRNRRNQGFRKTEPLYNNQLKHESSGTVFCDSSTGVDAQIDASNNPGMGKVWRTPSQNPLMADCKSATYASREDTGGVLATRLNPPFSWSPPKN